MRPQVQKRNATTDEDTLAQAEASAERDPAMRAFIEHCRARGVAVTKQRLAIFEALSSSRAHPSAEELHELVKQKLPSLSLATVYKNLDSLREIGAVGDVNPLHVRGRYEAVLPGTGVGHPHHHLVCTKCHRIFDLAEELVPTPRVDAVTAPGFTVQSVRVQVEGVCGECGAV